MAGHRQAVNTIPQCPMPFGSLGKMTGLGRGWGQRSHCRDTAVGGSQQGRSHCPGEKAGAQSSDLSDPELVISQLVMRGLHPPRVPAD